MTITNLTRTGGLTMRKYHTAFALIAILITQQSFADVTSTSNTTSAAVTSSDSDTSLKQCENIVNACLNAGFARTGGPGKAFWHDCMKPVLLGQTVAGVNIDSKDVSACRQFKITKMQKELQQLQQSMPTQTQMK